MRQIVRTSFLLNLCTSLLLSLVLGTGTALAYPEAVRHGYVNCNVCHVASYGGGLLTPYGRGLDKEIMATWSGEEEFNPLHGAVEVPESLLVGGGLRSVQTYTDTPSYRQGRYFLMQAEVELGWRNDRFTIVGSAGLDINSPDTNEDDKWVSPVHYAIVNLTKNLNIRAGRFVKNYGLNIPNHTAQTKRGLGWDEGSETYNAELNFATEGYIIVATAIGGRPDDKTVSSEKGYSVSAHRLLLHPALRIGGSYFAARATDDTNREIFGPNFAWGITSKGYLLGEYDWVRVAPSTGQLVEGYVTYTRVGWELFQGLDLTFVHESKKNDRRDSDLAFVGYGPGFTWSPRPHFTLYGEWQKQKQPLINNDTIDSAWLVAQYWL